MSRKPAEIVDKVPAKYRGWLLYAALLGLLLLLGVIIQRAC